MNPLKQASLAALLVGASAIAALAAPPTNMAPTPPMGWNSWNWHGKQAINETIVKETMDAMVAQGLRDAGYIYVVVDGGWRTTNLGPSGELLAHPVKFPGGMKALADYAHARGLKFGLHTVPGTHDAGGDPVGGFGHEEVQVRQFVEWGLDFVKQDKCKFAPGWDEPTVEALYRKWSDLLAHCGRNMVFSASAYLYRDWYPAVCHMARTTGDIRARVGGRGAAVFDYVKTAEELTVNEAGGRTLLSRKGGAVMTIVEINNAHAAFAGHGYWNDPDMMVTGDQGLTPDEQKAHFALWCIMSSPLMMGSDPRNLTALEKDILLNRECIAVNQDPTEQGRRVRAVGPVEVWVKHLAGKKAAVLLLNRDPKQSQPITFDVKDAGLPENCQVRDLFGREDRGALKSTLTLTTPPHAAWFLLVSPAPAATRN